MQDKNVEAMLDELVPAAPFWVTTRPANRRAEDAARIARLARARGASAEPIEPVAAALSLARALAGPSGEVVVAGSIFLVGEARALLIRPTE
jgi:dihydrofolate synthase/folylpolyglutamate synthase